jgi:excisionase family DNA binding protein
MSIRESSEYLGLSPDSIGRLVKSGTIPASRLGERVVRIKREDLDRFVSDNRIETNRSKWRR